MSRIPRIPITFLATVLAVSGIAAATAATRPSQRDAASFATVAGGGSGGVLRASVVCPDLRILPGTLTTNIAVGTGSVGDGSVTLSPASGTTRTGKVVLSAGKQLGRYSGPLTGPLELQADGTLANSLVAEQLSRANKTSDRGWAEARCEPPRAEQWFVGAATTPGDTPELELANPTDTVAATNVSVLTPAGLSPTSLGQNLTLAPHSVLNLRLSSLAPNATATAVSVVTTSGRVSAAVRDVRTNGQVFLGTDWLPVSSPAVVQTITGLPGVVVGATPRRTLIIADPGATDATVQVQVSGPQSTFVPVGTDAISVSAGTVKTVDLSKALGRNAGTVIVTSDDPTVPVVSTVLVDAPSTKNQPIHEITYLGPNSALDGAALVPIVHISAVIDSVLVLAAPEQSASLVLAITSPKGATVRMAVTVNGGTTRALSLRQLGAADNSTVAVLPGPDSPPVYAVRLIEEDGLLGPLLSSFALVGAPSQRRIPTVVDEPIGQ